MNVSFTLSRTKRGNAANLRACRGHWVQPRVGRRAHRRTGCDAIEHPYGGRQRPPVVASDNRFYDLWLTIGAILERTKS